MSSRPLCLLCFLSSDLISPAVTSMTFIPQSRTLTSTCLCAVSFLPESGGSFHLDYPSSHERIALGNTHILFLQPSIICPLLMGTICRCSGWEPWVLLACPLSSIVPAYHCGLSFRHLLMCPVSCYLLV